MLTKAQASRVKGKTKSLIRRGGSSSGDFEGGEVQWTGKVIHCAKAIGVTMEGSRGGWNSLVEFA